MALPADDDGARLARYVARARAGDPDALDALLRDLYAPTGRFLTERLRSQPADVVADCVQEAMVRVARHVASCDGRSDRQVLAWTFTVAHHAALNYLRSAASGAALRARGLPLTTPRLGSAARVFAPGPHGAPPEPRWDTWPDGGDEPGPACEALCRIAVAAQEVLDEADAGLLWGRLVWGASWQELAAQFGTTPQGARRRFQRGQHRLRRRCLQRIHALPAAARDALLARLARAGVTAHDGPSPRPRRS